MGDQGATKFRLYKQTMQELYADAIAECSWYNHSRTSQAPAMGSRQSWREMGLGLYSQIKSIILNLKWGTFGGL